MVISQALNRSCEKNRPVVAVSDGFSLVVLKVMDKNEALLLENNLQ
mgnify:FL=1